MQSILQSLFVVQSFCFQAPANPTDLKAAHQWFVVQYVNSFTLSGKGVFDGQGATAWKQNDCTTNKDCKMLCMVNKY